MSIIANITDTGAFIHLEACVVTISLDTLAALIPALKKVSFNAGFGGPCDHEVALTRELLKALEEANS